MNYSIRIGVDLGGTKIAAIALAPDGKILAESNIASPRDDYCATLEAVRQLVLETERAAGAGGSLGIAVPGSLSPVSRMMQNANSTWLNGRRLDRDLERILERPVRLANDANCFALSEGRDGSGRDACCLFGVILGTGCGGGLVIKGNLVDGPRGIGGEWGHNPLPWPKRDETPGPECWCGHHGCMEQWVSGPALSADHMRHTGIKKSAEEIALSANTGDASAIRTLQRHADRLSRGLAAVVNILDPDIIVLGGGLSRMHHLYEVLPAAMAPYIFAEDKTVRIAPPKFGAASGVRGAAWLWDDVT